MHLTNAVVKARVECDRYILASTHRVPNIDAIPGKPKSPRNPSQFSILANLSFFSRRS